MYAIIRITEEYVSKKNQNAEKFKVVSCRKLKGDAEEQMEILNREVDGDTKTYRDHYNDLINNYNGNFSYFKEKNPEGYEYIDKFRKSGMENFVRHEIQHVSKWT